MMAPHPCADALAFEAAAALDAYETQLAVAARAPADAASCASADAELRRVCSRCLGLPQLSVACVALLLSHYRLLAELTRLNTHRAGAPLLLLQTHQACIARLRRQCRELFVAPHLQ